MSVGVYLKELRQAKGISQKELSGLTNGEVSNAEISRLESGIRKKPSPAILKLLAPYLNVPVSMLLTKAGYMDEAQASALPETQSAGAALSGGQQTGNRGGKAEEEIRALQEANERLKKENRRIMDETLVVIEEGTSLRAETDNYRKKLAAAEDTARKAKQGQEALEEELAALKAEISPVKEELVALKEKGAMLAIENTREQEEEVTRLKGEAQKLTEQKNSLEEENRGLQAIVGNLEGRLKETQESESREDQAKAAERENEVTELKALLEESESSKGQLARDKTMIEQELMAARETAKINMPVFEAISRVQIAGMDLGKIFIETAKDAAPEDLETLGRLMQAMNRDAIKASDKRMLMDILKRFVK